MVKYATVAAGLSTGLLLGLLIGLSTSPVAAVVVGSLVTLAAAFLGFKSPGMEEAVGANRRDSAMRRWGVAALALSCVGGVLVGVAIRAGDLLSPTPARLVHRFTEAGYSPEQARAIVALRVAGLVPKDATVRDPGSEDLTRRSVLFAAEAQTCQDLNPENHPDAANVRQAFANAGGQWAAFAGALKDVNPTSHRLLLEEAWRLKCR
jgi:hypothetical protein